MQYSQEAITQPIDSDKGSHERVEGKLKDKEDKRHVSLPSTKREAGLAGSSFQGYGSRHRLAER